ncbi:hypothetical protein BD94_3499 [Elizabethkingia anophelis NUHP1]|uniref:Uncharacterized protein n=1 Tax=Elizabethkingia anophelis NUHP1 TaxID=1338011 RepID=A0A077EM15_9FLAO|nr:hypothetical protein BD94_3499 [Elizabethkingia anophelis NUHP1]
MGHNNNQNRKVEMLYGFVIFKHGLQINEVGLILYIYLQILMILY